MGEFASCAGQLPSPWALSVDSLPARSSVRSHGRDRYLRRSKRLVFVDVKEVGSFGNLASLEHFVRLSIAQQVEPRGCIQRTFSPQKFPEV
jgi:hypothetical protein